MRCSDATRGALVARMATVLFLLVCVALRATSALDRLVVDLEEEKTEGVTSPSIADPIKDMIEKNKQSYETENLRRDLSKLFKKYFYVIPILLLVIIFTVMKYRSNDE